MKDILFLVVFIISWACNGKQSAPKDEAESVIQENIKSLSEDSLVYDNVKSIDRLFEIRRELFDTVKAMTAVRVEIAEDIFNSMSVRESTPFIVYDTLLHQKRNGTFSLHFDNGKSHIFRDVSDDYGDAMAIYKYAGYLAHKQKYIVEVQLWENYICLLIDKRNGSILVLPSIPYFNETGTKIIVDEDNPYDDNTVYYICNWDDEKPKVSYVLITEYRDEEKVYWQNNNTIDVKYTTIEEKEPLYCRIFAVNKKELPPLPDHWRGKYFIESVEQELTGLELKEFTFNIDKYRTQVSITSKEGSLIEKEYWAMLDLDSILHLFYQDNNIHLFSMKQQNDIFFIEGLGIDGSEMWKRMDKE